MVAICFALSTGVKNMNITAVIDKVQINIFQTFISAWDVFAKL